jgi:hypothetical protein
MTNLVIKFLTVEDNFAERFARWMSDRRAELGITLDVLEERTGIKKQHLSVLERAAPHSLTGKPVIPKRPTVEKIAKGLESPLSDALEAAGYTTKNGNLKRVHNAQEFLEVLQQHGLKIPQFASGLKGLENVGEDELNEVLETMLFQLSQRARKKAPDLDDTLP